MATETVRFVPQPFTPVQGTVYRHRNGTQYRCVRFAEGVPVLTSTESGWTMQVHGLAQYPSGLIEWDYSTDGHWEPEVYTWVP